MSISATRTQPGDVIGRAKEQRVLCQMREQLSESKKRYSSSAVRSVRRTESSSTSGR
jgi:hypothetical protein